MKALRNVAVMALLLGPVSAPFAADPEPSPNTNKTPDTVLDRSHEVISRQVDEISGRIDMFLGGKRVCEDSTGSYVQAGGSVALPGDREVRFDHVLRVKLVLPNTRDRLRVLLESDPEKDVQEPLSPGARSPTESESFTKERSDVTKLSAALQFALQEWRKFQFNIDAGARVRLPPDPFARFGIKRAYSVGEWRILGSETVFWFDSLGAGEKTQVDVERHVYNCILFRATSEVGWKERKRSFELSQGLALFQELTWRDLLAYKAGVTGATRPSMHIENWGLGIEYRRRLHKNWLFVSIEPALTFAKAERFEAERAINRAAVWRRIEHRHQRGSREVVHRAPHQ
jgi:hypothetical protein